MFINSPIYVMWLRQIIRYWRSRGRMIGSLGQPLLFFLALGFGLGPIFARAGAGNYIQFLAPGVISMTILFSSIFSGIEVIWDRQFGFLKETLVAPVPRWKIMLGKTLGGATIALAQATIVFILTLFFGFHPTNILAIVVAYGFMFLIAFLFSAFGVALASNLEDMQAFPIIINFLIMPIFFLSGALFPLNDAPKTIEVITLFNPLTYGVEAIRYFLTGSSFINPIISLFVLSILGTLVFFTGNYFFSKIEA
jgi:ABC-2 type transport system permease protein